MYDRSPLDAVRFEGPLAALKADLKNGVPVFQQLISKYLVGNQHRYSSPVCHSYHPVIVSALNVILCS